MAGCSGASSAPTMTYVAPAPTVSTPDSAAAGAATAGQTIGHAMPSAAETDAAWAARPDFVRSASDRTQEAYAFAIARPDILDWMPCYCGCVAMDHRNNTDCYLKPRAEGGPIVFEEHASYCQICVDITLTARTMTAEGQSPLQVRLAVDGEFGGSAPGTNTSLPAQ